MRLVLHPRIAAGDRVRVWVGAFDRLVPPVLRWRLNGLPRNPLALQPIQSVRSKVMVRDDELRAFTGVYEFQGQGISPGTTHHVEVRALNGTGTTQRGQVLVRTLPAHVPKGFSGWFNVLLVSCFHLAKDRTGLAGHVVSMLANCEQFRPDMTLLLGDQVYLDLPPIRIVRGLRGLARKFENDYRLNWTGSRGYAEILRTAPSVSIPDDHEYWNNYPHKAPLVWQTWSKSGRKEWKRAAKRMFKAFQLHRPGGLGVPIEFDIPPLSFFLMDTRSSRDSTRKFVLSPSSLKRFQAWVTRVVHSNPVMFGVIATGQPLLDKAPGKIKGGLGDYNLPSYGDYRTITNELAKLADGGRQFLLLSGDVHWGRVSVGRNRILGARSAGFYEVISSPASLVGMIGKDQVLTAFSGIKSLFGNADPFPRHPEPREPPRFLAMETLGKRFECEKLHLQKGNQVVLLSFRKVGFGLELLVHFWPIHRHSEVTTPKRVGPLKLATA